VAIAPTGTPAFTFEQIIILLSNGIAEKTIICKLKKTPSIFAEQVKELRDATATVPLIAAMTNDVTQKSPLSRSATWQSCSMSPAA